MSDEAPPPPEATMAAAEAATSAEPPPPPEPETETETETEDLPEGQDTFDRSYVEKLRSEAAKWRTRTRDFESYFSGYSEAERSAFLELAAMLNDPARKGEALERFRGVTTRLAAQLGEEAFPTVNTEPTPTPEPDPQPQPQESGTAALTPDEVKRLVAEQLQAVQEEQKKQSEIEAAFAEAESLDPGYKDPAAKAHLFAVAQNRQVSLAEAHKIIQAQLAEAIDAAVAEHMEGLRTGKHAPRLPSADGTNVQDAGPPKTLEEARKRAEERFRAAGFG